MVSRSQRVSAGVPASFRARRLAGEGHILNVSEEGVFIRSRLLPRPDDDVRILFCFSGKTIEVRGTVRWTTDRRTDSERIAPGFGVLLDRPGRDFLEFFQVVLAESSEKEADSR